MASASAIDDALFERSSEGESFRWNVWDSLRLIARKLLGSLTLLAAVSQNHWERYFEENNILMKLRPQCLDHLLPISMCRQTAPWCAGDAMFAIKLHVERIKSMTTRTDRDADTISIFGNVLLSWQGLVL